MNAIKRFADFLRLTDDDGRLSLTHLALFVGIYLLAMGKSIAWGDFAAFAVALASYRVKQAFEGAGTADSETVASLGQAVTSLQAEVRKLASPERLAKLRDGLK